MSSLDAASLESSFKVTGGVVVTFGSESTWGHVDEESVPVIDEGGRPGVIGLGRSVVVPTGTLSAGKGDRITAGGSDLIVRAPPEKEGPDGALTRFWVSDGRA